VFNSLYLMVDAVEQVRRPALALCLASGVLVATNASAETKMVKAVPSASAQYSFTVLPDYPFSISTTNNNNTPRSINNNNVIAGSENGQSYVLVQPDYYAPVTDTSNNAVGTATVLGLSNGVAPMLAGSVFGFENGGGFVRTNDTYFLVAYPN